MAGKYGTKESKELLTLVKIASLAIISEVKKDGFQPKDLLAVFKSEAFEKAIMPAVEGIELVPAELSELGVLDGVDLGRFAYGVMDEILDALKGVVKAA